MSAVNIVRYCQARLIKQPERKILTITKTYVLVIMCYKHKCRLY